MSNPKHILCMGVLLLALAGCENDRIEPGGNWQLDAGSDAADTEPTETDGDTPDGGDGGPSDGGPPDGGDTDPRVPPEYSPDPAIPSQPRANAVCNDNAWCWLHPSPLPHSIDNLRRVDGQIYATARDGAVRGWQPLVWDSSGFTLLDKPVPSGQRIVDMATTPEGWIALTPDGTVHDVRPEGVSASRPHDGEDYKGLIGVSFDAYLAWQSDRDAVLRHDAQSLEYNALPTVPAKTRLWEDGTLWGLAELRDDKRAFLSGDWMAYPEPTGFFDEKVSAMGPSPTSECASDELWVASDPGQAFRWDDFETSWEEIEHPGGRMQAIGCNGDGAVAAVDDTGQLMDWNTETWTSETVSRLPLNDFTVADGKTYLAGVYGTLAEASAGSLEHATGGFRIPPSESPSYYGTGYQDMWVSSDGETLVLAHGSGLYMGTEQGWSKMPAPERLESDLRNADRIEVWGTNAPEFAIVSSTFLRWDGSRWSPVQRGLGPFRSGTRRDLAGTPEGRVWLATDTELYRKEPVGQWSHATSTGSGLDQQIERDNLTLTAITIDRDASLVVAASGALYNLKGQPGDWRLSSRTTTPCQTIEDVRISSSSTYVVGLEGCVARKDGDGWTEYQLPDASEWAPTVFEARAYEVVTPAAGRSPLVATSVGLLALRDDGTTDIQFTGDFRDAVAGVSGVGALALHRSGVVARYND